MFSKCANCTRLLEIKNSWKSFDFTSNVGENSQYFVGIFSKTIIPLVLDGYEMIIYHLISNAHS